MKVEHRESTASPRRAVFARLNPPSLRPLCQAYNVYEAAQYQSEALMRAAETKKVAKTPHTFVR